MAQTYTLDEAADKLGISSDEMKRRLREDWKHVRAFRDGSTLRFRAADIEELARMIGTGSDPDASSDEVSALELNLDDSDEKPAAKSGKPAKPKEEDPLILDGDDVFVLAPDEPKKSGSGKIAKPSTKSDSDVRLEKPGKKKASDDDQESILTEEIQIDLPSSSKSGKLTGKSGRLKGGDSGKLASGKSGKMPKPAPQPEADSSEFELSLEPTADESSDEFELSINTGDSSEEIGLGETPKAKKGNSGINLSNPADSGPSLEKKKKAQPVKPASDDEIDFELSLDAGSSKVISSKSGPKKKKDIVDSDSEFELTLDDASDLAASLDAETSSFVTEEPKGDIFETDFEIPALDDASGSEVVSLEDADTDLESSDFDLALDDSDVQTEDDSGSEAVEIDEDDDTGAKKKKLRPLSKKRKAEEVEDDSGAVDLDDMGFDEESSVGEALVGVSKESPDEEEEGVVVVAGTAPWPGWVAIPLLFGTFVMFIGGIMGYELLNNMWGYHQPEPPASMVVEQVSGMILSK